MARGRNKHQNSKNCDGESVPTQTGQEEEIASPLPSPRTSPRRGIPKEKEGINERDLSQKTPPRHTSLQRGTPDNTEGIYPADTSRKDPDLQTGHQDAAAAAISPNAQPPSTEAPLFVIDHTLVPPPTEAQLLQEQHIKKQKNSRLFLECLHPIWHNDTFIPERLLEDYSNKAHISAIATAIESSKTLQETESQLHHDDSEGDNDYGQVQNPTAVMIVSNNFLKALPRCPTIHWPSQMFNDPQHCFCPCSTNTKP